MERPGLGVARADVDELFVRVVRHAVPHCATAAVLPPLLLDAPGGCRLLHRFVFESLRGISRHGVEPPSPTARHRVVGVEESARGPVAAAHADDDFPFRDAGRHRDREVVLRIRDARFPDRLACVRVERLQASVDDRRDDQAVVDRDAAIDDAAADFRPHRGLIDLRIPSPALASRSRVDGKDDAPVGDAVDRAVGEKRCGFLAPPPEPTS